MKTLAEIIREYNIGLHQMERANLPTFAPAVVFSREVASGGFQIARMVAEGLHFQLWDRRLLDEVEKIGHVDIKNAQQYDEKLPGLLSTIGMVLRSETTLTTGDFQDLLKRSIHSLLALGNVVLVWSRCSSTR
jgi:hypothetical protein